MKVTDPYVRVYASLAADERLTHTLRSIQRNYPKSLGEIVFRICCEYYRDSLTGEVHDYGVFVKESPTAKMRRELSDFLHERKRLHGSKIYELVLTALREWCRVNLEFVSNNGIAVWSDDFRATHLGREGYLIVRDPDEVAAVMAVRESKRLADPFDTVPRLGV